MTTAWVATEGLTRAVRQLPPHVFYGRVKHVLGLLVEGYLPETPIGALCMIHTQHHGARVAVPAEVIGLKGEDAVLMPIGETYGMSTGDLIEQVQDAVTVRVTDALLGRVVDGSGAPMDGKAPIQDGELYRLYRPTSNPVERQLIETPLSLGVRAIDGFLTCAIGQRVVVMAGSGVGKSTLLGMVARHTAADVNVIALIGERGREVREFLEHDLGAEGLARSVVVVATSDQPALVRMRAAFAATSIAEYFRDRGANVLLVMDSLTRFAMASREVGLALGEPPTMKGYTPSLFSLLPRLLERVGTGVGAGSGSITGLYTVLTEGDDLMDPIADAVRAIVDGHIVLSRRLATMGHYPPIDLLQSLSRVMGNVVSDEHVAAMQIVRRALALYTEMEDFIRMGVYAAGKNPELDLAVKHIDAIQEFLRQAVTEASPMAETLERLHFLARQVTV